jgi:hypothetical protein
MNEDRMRRTLQRLIDFFEARRVFTATATVLALTGLAFRVLWVSRDQRLPAINSEMLWVARSFATTGQLADAYGPGTGRTAHVAPVMPIFAGTIYRLLGPTSVTSEVVLIGIALLVVAASVWAVDRAMKRLGSPAIARLAALAVFSLAPLNFSLEMENFRVWEGGVAAAGLAFALAYVLKKDGEAKAPGWREALLLAAGGGVMAMISPPSALAIYGLLGLLAWRRRGVLAVPVAGALSLVLLVAISYPWAIRNEGVFGEKVWSRTNFGFNYAQGFYDAAVAPKDPKAAFLGRLAELDPYTSRAAYERMMAVGGEQAYSKLWTARTNAWIAAHPAGAARIVVRRVGELYFPPKWFWFVYSEKAAAVAPRQAVIWAITILAGLCIAWRLLARDWRYLYVLAAVTLPIAPYVLAQPILRYRYTIVALLTYLAAEFLWRVVARIVQPQKPSVSKSDTLVPEHVK